MLPFFFRLLARLPLSWLHRAGTALGWLVYGLSPSYAARLGQNLHASGVCAGGAECRAVRRAAVAEAGKSLTELITLWFGEGERVRRLVVDCHGWDVVEAARDRGNGVIFLTPHLGCFEIAAAYAAQRIPLTVLYRPPRLRWLEPLMVAGRTRWGAVVEPANVKGVRGLYRALVRGDAIGLLPDQAPGAGEGAWASFFGRPAYTMTLVRRLHERSGAALIMAFAERLPAGGGYRLYFEAIPTAGFDETALNRAVEAQVRRRPEQYLWSYNRYKVPAGAVPPGKAEGGRRKAEG
jgi:Kdo2-lipid IVA lauroyltransferase/acyltransferase